MATIPFTCMRAPIRRATAMLAALAIVVASVALGVVHARPAGVYPLGPGVWLVVEDGGIFSFGSQFFGSTGNIALNKPIVGMAPFPFLEGYWMVASDGGVFSFGSAGFHGSTGAMRLNKPVVGMAAHPSGNGYWLVASDGGIFSFDDSKFLGSMGGKPLNKPIVAMSATPSGNGYWMVASDGGIFAFGDAKFFGSMGGSPLNKPIVGMATTPSGNGYWMVASDGGIFAFGDAKFFGSTGNIVLNKPVVGMAPTATGNGYWLDASDGGIFAFGDAPFKGSMGGTRLQKPAVGMAARPPLAVDADPFADASGRTEAWTLTNGDWRLNMTWNGSGTPAGARVLGVEGLDVGQLGSIGFFDETGTCAGSPQLTLFVDTNGDGRFDTTRGYSCANGGAGQTKRFNPVSGATAAAPLPSGAVVTSMEVALGAGGNASIDDIFVAGIDVPDFRTWTAAGTAFG